MKSKFLSYAESDGTAFGYKSTKFNKINDNFINFFKKKIQFNSAFDHAGSKQFLNSKKAALEKIIIDEDSITSNNEDTQSNSNKKKNKKRERRKYRKSDDHRTKSSDDVLEYTEKKKFRLEAKSKSKSKRKSKEKEKEKGKEKDKYKEKGKGKRKEKDREKERLIKTIVTKELDISKKLDKCYSSQELKMFKDEEINKIKPIKSNFNKMKTNKVSNQLAINFPFVGSEKSIDSIFKVVSEMDN